LAGKGRIRWLGHVKDDDLLTALWSNAGVYWHGHSVGGTNPALLQALGAGAPTVAFKTPFNEEVVENGDQLFAGSAKDLAAILEKVIDDRELAMSYRNRGQIIVKERYSWKAVCSEYEELLLAAVRGKTAHH
jgi:glycosyltransferase involved in cell wall biosynthesis